ncbi:MAG TPA: hypothetical protein VFX25_00330, partial [Streptosporangiaceae bacterium]|nr:hypothetical protein [Streptosporangiaceae bacterium]
MPRDPSADRVPAPAAPAPAAPAPAAARDRRLGPGGPVVSRLGLGLAALGRPAYITGGRAGDLPDRS